MILEKNIPNNWSIHSVEELFDFINTKSLSRAQLISEKGENQYLHYGDIHSTFKYVLVDTEKIQLPSVLKDVQISGNIEFLKDGDLVIADASEDLDGVAKCIELKNIGDKKVIGGLHTIVCRDKIGKTANEIRPYLFLNAIVLKSIKRIATGASVLGISKGRLKAIKLILPPLPEQQKIAEILSTVDDKIEIIDQQITETQALKKGLMQRLLTKGIGHTEFKDSPLGMIPENWEVLKLSEICDEIFLGLTSKVDYVESGGFPFVRATDINSGRLSFENIKYISEKQHKKLTVNRLTKKGDVLVSKSGTLGTCAIVDVDTEFSTYESIITIQPKVDLLLNKFLLQILQDTNVQKRMIGARVGGIVGHLNLMTFRKLMIPLPKIEEQLQISDLLSTLDEKLEILLEKKTHYQELKQGLMQQLLTGKIRVKV